MPIHDQALARGFGHRHQVLTFWEAPERIAYYALVADAMLGGNGFCSFLHQAELDDIMGVLEALQALECPRLTELNRRGITLAAREGGEFIYQVDEDWIAREGAPIDEQLLWSAIDSWEPGGTWSC